jgi:hypothetical protein
MDLLIPEMNNMINKEESKQKFFTIEQIEKIEIELPEMARQNKLKDFEKIFST